MKPLYKTVVYLLGAMVTPVWASSVTTDSTVFKGSAILVIKPERVSDFQKAVHDIIGPTRKESGNISYEAYQVVDQQGKPTNRFVFHEIWKSEKAMMVDHKENATHMKRFFSLIGIGTDHSWVESFEVNGNTVKSLH
jgi:quinol monooxygenase YgiN